MGLIFHENFPKIFRAASFNPFPFSLPFTRSSHSQMFFKIVVLENSAIFTGKHLCWSLFVIKLQAWRPATLLALYQADFFELLKGRRAFWLRQKNYKCCLLRSNHLKLDTTHFLDFIKNFNISHVIKMMTSAKILITSSFSNKFFWSCFQIFHSPYVNFLP